MNVSERSLRAELGLGRNPHSACRARLTKLSSLGGLEKELMQEFSQCRLWSNSSYKDSVVLHLFT